MPILSPQLRTYADRMLRLLSLLVLVGCSQSTTAPTSTATSAQTATSVPTPSVDVVTVAFSEVPNVIELPGRIEAYRTAEVRARVSGIVTKRLYQEGQVVKAGTPLFQINPELLQAATLEAEAELARAQAQLFNVNDKLQRYQALVSDQSVSQRDYRAAQAEVQLANAEVASAKAKLARATLDLGYAHVTAPIAGVARRALITEGALVAKDAATPLTTIEQVNPVYVNFSQSASDVFALRQALRAGTLKGNGDQFDLSLILPDGTVYPSRGTLSFKDVAVNPNTDSVVMRAIFENAQQILMPGAYVRIKIRQATQPNAILIPRDALIRDQFSTRVWVVNPQNSLESREVQTRRMIDQHWVIERGLQPGERVVISNVATQSAGTRVNPKQVNLKQVMPKQVHAHQVTTPASHRKAMAS